MFIGIGLGVSLNINQAATRAPSNPAFPGAALILTWTSLQTDLTPTWQFDYADVAVADVVTLQRASDSGFSTDVTSYTDTIDSISPITTLDFATGNWAEQTWYVRAKQSRDGFTDSDWSNTETILISSDVTAPVLSSPTDTNSGETGYSGSVSTDHDNGTLFWVVSTASNTPTSTQIIAGQMHTGAAAVTSGNQAVSGTGVQNVSGSGLSGGSTYYVHYAHRDAANNISDPVSGDGLTTSDETAPVLSSPVDAATSSATSSGGVTTTESNGTLYWVVSTASNTPTAAQVKAGNDHTGSAAVDSGNQAVAGTGAQTITGGTSGLTASTQYYTHFMHEDAATNQSSVSSADGFTTDAAITFDPATLFVGKEGVWWDFTDTSTMWQSNAGSTAVTTAGDPIGQIDDKAAQATLASPLRSAADDGTRPTYVSGGGAQWTAADNEWLRTTLAARYTGTTMYAWIVFKPETGFGNDYRVLSLVDSDAPTHDYDVADCCSFLLKASGNVGGYRNGNKSQTTFTTGSRAIVESKWDGTNHTLYRDTTGATPVTSSGAMDANKFHVGSLEADTFGTTTFQGVIYEIGVVLGAIPDAGDIADLQAYLQDKYP